MCPEQASKEALSSRPIALCLKIDINHFTVLVDSPPQIMLLAVYLHEDFIDVSGISVASMTSLQTAGINRSEFDAPQPDRFTADGDAPFGE
jgi:hypothetical protein